VIDAIQKPMERETAADPIGGVKWTGKTTEKIAGQLKLLGIDVSRNTAGQLLRQMKYSLRTNRKQSRPVPLPTATASSAVFAGSGISSGSAEIRF
jgi:hypothetical protein